MANIDEIKSLKNYYYNTLYNKKVAEQKLDQTFYDDMFGVPQILAPVKIFRTGTARRLIDDPASQIVTSNPQAYRGKVKETQKDE